VLVLPEEGGGGVLPEERREAGWLPEGQSTLARVKMVTVQSGKAARRVLRMERMVAPVVRMSSMRRREVGAAVEMGGVSRSAGVGVGVGSGWLGVGVGGKGSAEEVRVVGKGSAREAREVRTVGETGEVRAVGSAGETSRSSVSRCSRVRDWLAAVGRVLRRREGR
jgi:hypothetical protein